MTTNRTYHYQQFEDVLLLVSYNINQLNQQLLNNQLF